MTGYAAASLLTLKTTKASMWDGTVFVYKVRHDFVGNKSTVYFGICWRAIKWGTSTRERSPGSKATPPGVLPSDAGAKPTAKIVIPWHLRGSTGNLTKGTPVVYVEFDDASGLLLGRADGEWGAYLPGLTAGSISVPEGDVNASGVSLSGHRHGGIEPGSGTTGRPT